MPVELIEQVLGKNGVAIWKKAHGLDDAPVIAYNERKSISTERTFAKDTTDGDKLHAIMLAMAENLRSNFGAATSSRCVTVKVRYADFSTKSMQRRIPYTAADHHLVPTAKDLLEQLLDKRVRVRLVGVRYSHLVGGGFQINLFDDTEERVKLYQALDRIRLQYGDRSVVRAAGLGSPNHRPHQPLQRRPPSAPRPPAPMTSPRPKTRDPQRDSLPHFRSTFLQPLTHVRPLRHRLHHPNR